MEPLGRADPVPQQLTLGYRASSHREARFPTHTELVAHLPVHFPREVFHSPKTQEPRVKDSGKTGREYKVWGGGAEGCLSLKASVAGTPYSLRVGEGSLLLAAKSGIQEPASSSPEGHTIITAKLGCVPGVRGPPSPVYLPEPSEVSCHTQASILTAATWGHMAVSHDRTPQRTCDPGPATYLSPHKPPLGSAHPERTPQCTQRLLHHRSTASALTEEIKRLARGRRREATGIGHGAGRGGPGGRTFSFTLGYKIISAALGKGREG